MIPEDTLTVDVVGLKAKRNNNKKDVFAASHRWPDLSPSAKGANYLNIRERF